MVGGVMNQTRIESFVEAMFNVVIGFSINYVANLVLIPIFVPGGHLSLAANWWMGCVYTLISVARSYTIRRWFNAGLHRAAAAVAFTLVKVQP